MLLLLRAAVGSAWFSGVYALPHCWLAERQVVVQDASGPLALEGSGARANWHGTVAAYMGPNTRRFCEAFSTLGYVPGHSAWSRRGCNQRA